MESLRLKTISPEPKSWRWTWRTKKERRRTKVSSYCNTETQWLNGADIRLIFFVLCDRWLGERQ